MGTNGDRINVRRHPLPHVETYEVTSEELDRIESESLDVGQDFQFASVFLTLGVAGLIAMLTTKIEVERVFNGFLSFTIAGFTFAAYFGIKWIRCRRRCASTIERIRARQIGPVGEQGGELNARDLQRLPAQEPIPAEDEGAGADDAPVPAQAEAAEADQ